MAYSNYYFMVLDIETSKHMEFDEKFEYKIVGTIESDPDKGMISNESPIGKALMGRKKGDVVEIKTPNGGSYSVKVIKIS